MGNDTKQTTTARMIEALEKHRDRSGAQICEMTGILPAVLYPALAQLERDGVIESRWYDEQASYPRKRVYRLVKEINYA